jgi:cytoskeletal protein RodZ
MAWFNRRKQNTDVLPEEVREYYQTERRERTGMAWLLAAGTLVVTFIIAAGLFFGGRWAYRAAFNHNDNKTASNTDNSLRVDENGNVVGGNQQPSDNSSGQSTGTSSTSTNTPSPSNTNGSTNNNSSAATNSGAAKTPTSTPNTGPVELINTGPGDETGM